MRGGQAFEVAASHRYGAATSGLTSEATAIAAHKEQKSQQNASSSSHLPNAPRWPSLTSTAHARQATTQLAGARACKTTPSLLSRRPAMNTCLPLDAKETASQSRRLEAPARDKNHPSWHQSMRVGNLTAAGRHEGVEKPATGGRGGQGVRGDATEGSCCSFSMKTGKEKQGYATGRHRATKASGGMDNDSRREQQHVVDESHNDQGTRKWSESSEGHVHDFSEEAIQFLQSAQKASISCILRQEDAGSQLSEDNEGTLEQEEEVLRRRAAELKGEMMRLHERKRAAKLRRNEERLRQEADEEMRRFEDALQERLQVQVGILMRDRDAKGRDCASVIRDLERQAAAIAQLVSESRRKAELLGISYEESVEKLKRQHWQSVASKRLELQARISETMRLAEADPEATRHSEAGTREEAQKGCRNDLSPNVGGLQALLETSNGTRNTPGVITLLEPCGEGWDEITPREGWEEITPKELFHSLPFACEDGAALLPLQEEEGRWGSLENTKKKIFYVNI